MKKDEITTNSLAHTKWDCKYHIVFAPKYRRKVFYEDNRAMPENEIPPAMRVDIYFYKGGN